MSPENPRLSFGLPVRNGERAIAGTLDCLLAQTFSDLEIVVSDNASTYATAEICREYARRDPRVRFFPSDRDVGQIENFNRVYRKSRGEFFRWIGCDDRVECGYAALCVDALDQNPAAVGVTTSWSFIDDSGCEHSLPFHGERVESPDRLRRLDRFLWFMQADRNLFDPIYSMLRRETLERTRLLRVGHHPDVLLALELSLFGPFCHVDEQLARRRLPADEAYEVLAPRWHPSLSAFRHFGHTRKYLAFLSVLVEQELPLSTRARGAALVAYYWARERPLQLLQRSRRKMRRILSRSAIRSQ